jgi:amino-acid N-acetyltransferase
VGGRFAVRRAQTSDVTWIQRLIEPLVRTHVLLGKAPVVFYESVQEFRIADDSAGTPIGCGALHIMWEDLAEVRTLAVVPEWLGKGVGHALLTQLEADAKELGVRRLFCLTFEVEFFRRHGFTVIDDSVIDSRVYSEMEQSSDEGVAEFLDISRVKPNTLGNTRMLKYI